jgi:hypothetical protein
VIAPEHEDAAALQVGELERFEVEGEPPVELGAESAGRSGSTTRSMRCWSRASIS